MVIRGVGAAGFVLMVLSLAVSPETVRAQGPGTSDALLGTGDYGAIAFVAKLDFPAGSGELGDVSVSPDGNWAFVANSGSGNCRGEVQAGTWIVDISDRSSPELIGFVPHARGSRPGDGVHVVQISTKFFDGALLVVNNERCESGGKGGISLYDVSDPRKPKKISEHFGDTGSRAHNVRSVFGWDAGENAYVAVADADEANDLDILDVTNPNRPRLIAEYDLNALVPAIAQPEIGLADSRIQDMVVKQISGKQMMVVSYRDGGFVFLDVSAPADAVFLDDTDYSNPDPELLESSGIALTPEGNAHYAEWMADNQFIIGIDEDLAPYRETTQGNAFDGWGYVHLYSAGTLNELDTYAIAEAHDPAFAVGFGNLSAHEVATDPVHADRAYVAYSSGGLRALEIQCVSSSSCELVEVGGYLDPQGNNLRGIEAVSDPSGTLIVASDSRHGSLWIFRRQ